MEGVINMVFIFTDFGTYTRDESTVETIIKKHNHLRYDKRVYPKHIDPFKDDGDYVSVTWFIIKGATRRDMEALYEDLDKCGIPIALQT
jgi:hypothetical protein